MGGGGGGLSRITTISSILCSYLPPYLMSDCSFANEIPNEAEITLSMILLVMNIFLPCLNHE